jgi:tetratricopeptide (TPR) repeat protein
MSKNPRPDPHKVQAMLQQAWQIHQAGRLAQAEKIYRNILSVSPAHPDANNLMGLLSIQTQRPGAAEKYIRQALRGDPVNAQSHFNLGIACKDLRRFEEAALHFGRAAKLQPGNAEALSSQGNALRLSGKAAEAVQILKAALRLAPGHRGARQNLGLALNDLGAELNRSGKTDQALECLRKALQYTPHNPQALTNIGVTLEQQGDLDNAARHYQAAVKARPQFADPHFFLAHLRTHDSTPAEIDSMRKLFASPGATKTDRVQLAFGLGFALEAAGDYGEAFRYMSEGHRLQGEESTFSLERETRRFKELKNGFSADHLTSMMDGGLADPRPVFIVGMPRSGTTLAEQILASHSEVHGAGEQTKLAEIVGSLAQTTKTNSGGSGPDIKGSQLRRAARAYMNLIATEAGDARRITDTTPMNFPWVGMAAMMLPRARFVICRRDPMDNCLSVFRQYLTGANDYAHQLEDLGGYYLLHRELTDHWMEVMPGRVHLFQYERVIADAEQEIRRLLGFCELPFEPRCVAFHQSDRLVRSPSAAQVRQPVYDSSVGAWRKYEHHLALLKEALGLQED